MGKTRSDRYPHPVHEKHPHVRGEDKRLRRRMKWTLETPPRAWGRLYVPSCLCASMEKHPHVRGEDGYAEIPPLHNLETPPRAWGRRKDSFAISVSDRNTPTCVGKTTQTRLIPVAVQKHPHVRGEDYVPYKVRIFAQETPPRAWGRPCLKKKSSFHIRNTPTCVGKTSR